MTRRTMRRTLWSPAGPAPDRTGPPYAAVVLVLLPPSESKAPAPAARADPWTSARCRSRAHATRVGGARRPGRCQRRGPTHCSRLGVGPSLAPRSSGNTRLRALPARPALEVYTGVLYDALGLADPVAVRAPPGRRPASSSSRRCGARCARRPDPAVPPRRCAADLGRRRRFRSSGGRRWTPRSRRLAGEGARRRLPLRADTPRHGRRPGSSRPAPSPSGCCRRGGRTVVSHAAKHTRGEVARHLLETGADPARPRAWPRCSASAGRSS